MHVHRTRPAWGHHHHQQEQRSKGHGEDDDWRWRCWAQVRLEKRTVCVGFDRLALDVWVIGHATYALVAILTHHARPTGPLSGFRQRRSCYHWLLRSWPRKRHRHPVRRCRTVKRPIRPGAEYRCSQVLIVHAVRWLGLCVCWCHGPLAVIPPHPPTYAIPALTQHQQRRSRTPSCERRRGRATWPPPAPGGSSSSSHSSRELSARQEEPSPPGSRRSCGTCTNGRGPRSTWAWCRSGASSWT